MAGKAVVIGGNGQLGSDIVQVWSEAGWDVASLTHADIRVESPESVTAVLHECMPDVVLNTAAFHNVPQCENDPERAWQVNGLGALNVGAACERIGARHMFFSTDYVFDGSKARPYLESDRPVPLNVYGVTKLSGEHFALNASDRACVVRISGIYGRVVSRAKGTNFVTTMMKAAREKPEVRVVDDEVLTPTPTREIARAVLELQERDLSGLFHLTCEGSCSWYEFAQVLFQHLHLSTPLLPVHATAFPSQVKRPGYSVLENGRAKEAGISPMPHWDEALVKFLTSDFIAR